MTRVKHVGTRQIVLENADISTEDTVSSKKIANITMLEIFVRDILTKAIAQKRDAPKGIRKTVGTGRIIQKDVGSAKHASM